MDCTKSAYQCPYHSCMGDNCQYVEVMINGGGDFKEKYCSDEQLVNLLLTEYQKNDADNKIEIANIILTLTIK